MKKVFSIIVLIMALLGIFGVTYYALSNKGVRDEVPKKNFKKVEKVTSNIANNKVSDVFNVQINGARHKVKFEYNVTFLQNNKTEINLIIYIDGKVIYEDIISNNIKAKSVENLFLLDNINSYVRATEKNISIIKSDETEYMVINIGRFTEYATRHYYVFTDRGKLLNNEGILMLDEGVKYTTSDNKELDIYYNNEKKYFAKIDKNKIYALEYKALEKNGIIEEYCYFVKNGEMDRELINTYEDIKIVNSNNNKK